MLEQADRRKRSQRAYNGCEAYEPQVMLSDNTIEYSVQMVLIANQNGSYGAFQPTCVIKSAAFGPREFESKFHKKDLKDAIKRQSVALAVARFREGTGT
jgi:hypothetical protein